ncbi:hypothetical protein HKD37_10G027790 [Glycine soja]
MHQMSMSNYRSTKASIKNLEIQLGQLECRAVMTRSQMKVQEEEEKAEEDQSEEGRADKEGEKEGEENKEEEKEGENKTAWHRYQDNVHLQWRQWHRVLTKLSEKQIDITLVKEFYSNIYVKEDRAPKYCKVKGQVIRFDAEAINDFLDTLYPDHQAIMTALCTSGGGFVFNANGAPWKLLRKDLATLAQTWSVLSYFNLAPTSHTSYLNVDKARLIYGLVMKMDMDLGSFISGQITHITQSSTSRLGFSALIIALCDAQGGISNTLTFESLSHVIILAYIKKNCWNSADPSIAFPRPLHARARAAAPDAPSLAQPPPTCRMPPAAIHLGPDRSTYPSTRANKLSSKTLRTFGDGPTTDDPKGLHLASCLARIPAFY